MITVVNKYHTNYPYVYCGRGSPFGNPFRMASEAQRDEVCDAYELWFDMQMKDPETPLYKAVQQLYRQWQSDKELNLGCFCAPKRCHCDTIKSYLEQLTD